MRTLEQYQSFIRTLPSLTDGLGEIQQNKGSIKVEVKEGGLMQFRTTHEGDEW